MVSNKMAAFTAWVEYVDTSTVLIFLVVILFPLWLLSSSDGPTNWPPDPKPWPLIGNADMFWNNDELYLTFMKLAKTYDDVVHLRVGSSGHMIMLSGQDVIRGAFVDKGEYFSNRSNISHVPLMKYTNKGKCTTSSFISTVRYLYYKYDGVQQHICLIATVKQHIQCIEKDGTIYLVRVAQPINANCA